MSAANFHVRHEVTPDRVWAVLDAIVSGGDYTHITQYDRQLSRLRQMGLVLSGAVEPTEQGVELLRIGVRRLDVAWELFHFLHYVRWNPSAPSQHSMFFTYRSYCDLLYDRTEADLNALRGMLAAEMNNRITQAEHFPRVAGTLTKGAISLSVNSLLGVEHWLAKLSPAAIVEGTFARRYFCAPELLLFALGHVTTITRAEWGVEQLLTEERRATICRVCLMDGSALDQALDWLFAEYPDIVQPGTTTGSYGRFVRVMRKPELKDILR